MTQNSDAFADLNQLVVERRLTPAQAQAALEAGQPETGQPDSGSSGGLPPYYANSTVAPWLRPDVLLVLFGTGFLSAAVLVSSFWSRNGHSAGESHGDLDMPVYTVGLVATGLLLAAAAAAWFVVREPQRRAHLMSWPGALGAVAVGQMLNIGLDDNDQIGYIAGGAIVALCALGHRLIRQPAYVVGAMLGLLLLYLQIFDDAYGFSEVDDDNYGIAVGVVVLIFTLLVTGAGWILPTRDLTAIIVGVGAALVIALTLYSISTVAMFQSFDSGEPDAVSGQRDNPLANDTWVLLAIALLLSAVWAALWWLRGHDGYRVLVVAMIASAFPAATIALATESAGRWGTALIAVGGLGLVLALLRGVGLIGSQRP